MLSAVLNGTWIWCRILRFRYRESINFASPKLKTLRGFKGFRNGIEHDFALNFKESSYNRCGSIN
jgi:hypothetical protein